MPNAPRDPSKFGGTICPHGWTASMCKECKGTTGATHRTLGICKHGWKSASCPKCRSRRNREAGRTAQREQHVAMGGKGKSPLHEEAAPIYDYEAFATEYVEGKTRPEVKQGAQVPQAFVKFEGTEWFRRALSQSTRALPAGSQAKPAVWVKLPGGKRFLIVDYGGGR